MNQNHSLIHEAIEMRKIIPFCIVILLVVSIVGCYSMAADIDYTLDCSDCGVMSGSMMKGNVTRNITDSVDLQLILTNVSDSVLIYDPTLFTITKDNGLIVQAVDDIRSVSSSSSTRRPLSYYLFGTDSYNTNSSSSTVIPPTFRIVPPHAAVVIPVNDIYDALYNEEYRAVFGYRHSATALSDLINNKIVNSHLDFLVLYKVLNSSEWKTITLHTKCTSAKERDKYPNRSE